MIHVIIWFVMCTAAIATLAGSAWAAAFLAIMTLVGLFCQVAVAVGKRI